MKSLANTEHIYAFVKKKDIYAACLDAGHAPAGEQGRVQCDVLGKECHVGPAQKLELCRLHALVCTSQPEDS